jgi:hypothetical protein
MKRYTLIREDGTRYESTTPGTVGGHRATRIYGRLDCPSALRALASGGYTKHRVFFADGATPPQRATDRVPAAFRTSTRLGRTVLSADAERSRCR